MPRRVQDISRWVVMGQEAVGADPKVWVGSSPDADRSDWWLFKQPKTGVKSGRPYRRGDDWAEALCADLARLLGLPSATVELARRGGDTGVMSLNVAPPGWDLVSGDTLLSEVAEYESCAGGRNPKGRPGHHPTNIAAVLRHVGPPATSPGDSDSALGVFIGYLVFDVWVANTDRHAENWAVLEKGTERRLAESFDHGSALASGHEDHELARFRAPSALQRFAGKGRAQRFDHRIGRTLLDVVTDAARIDPVAARSWRDRVCSVDTRSVERAVTGVPGMSDLRRSFILDLLEENRRRLRDVDLDA